MNLNARPVEKQQLPAALRRELIDIFADDVALLGTLTGRDFSHWLDE